MKTQNSFIFFILEKLIRILLSTGRHLLQNRDGDDDNNNSDDDGPRGDDNNGPDSDAFELNCTPRSIDQFPPDFMTPEQRENGGVTFHILLSVYIFCALAIVCDDYFVSSLESICDGKETLGKKKKTLSTR